MLYVCRSVFILMCYVSVTYAFHVNKLYCEYYGRLDFDVRGAKLN